jgi:phosphatidylserine/phosphatidylglycerophosphate/cardiolipin synthase-like enzyme
VNAPYVTGAACELLTDSDYVTTLRRSIQGAERRCLSTIFIIDLKTRCTAPHCVIDVVEDLRDAQWRGVDVRVLIGGSRSTFAIAEAAAVATAHLDDVGLPSRWLTSEKGVRGSHAKVVVADDTVLLGSHNWTPGAFHADTQDSVLIDSEALAEYFAARFEARWGDRD